MAYRPIDYILRGLRYQFRRTLDTYRDEIYRRLERERGELDRVMRSYRDEIYRRLEREYPKRHEARAYAEHERRRMEARVAEALRDHRSWVIDYIKGLIDDTLSEVDKRDEGLRDWFLEYLEKFREDFDRSRDVKLKLGIAGLKDVILPMIVEIAEGFLEDFFTGLEQGAIEAYE